MGRRKQHGKGRQPRVRSKQVSPPPATATRQDFPVLQVGFVSVREMVSGGSSFLVLYLKVRGVATLICSSDPAFWNTWLEENASHIARVKLRTIRAGVYQVKRNPEGTEDTLQISGWAAAFFGKRLIQIQHFSEQFPGYSITRWGRTDEVFIKNALVRRSTMPALMESHHPLAVLGVPHDIVLMVLMKGHFRLAVFYSQGQLDSVGYPAFIDRPSVIGQLIAIAPKETFVPIASATDAIVCDSNEDGLKGAVAAYLCDMYMRYHAWKALDSATSGV